MLSMSNVKAVDLSGMFPGGKNYLNPDNVILSGSTLTTSHDFVVHPNQQYTLSLPGTDMLGEDLMIVVSGTQTYINETALSPQNCTISYENTVCTFNTSVTETSLSVSITGLLVPMYYNAYGIEYFQLEEGSIATVYEAYIIPLTDTTSPEVNGAGAYIVSYQNQMSIQDIIQNHIYVYDEVDGDLTNDIVIDTDQYTGNEGIVGDYVVEMSVSDSSNNTAYFTLTVMVKDEIAPTITGPDSITIEVFDEKTITELITEQYNLVDEYDGILTPTIIVDEYTTSKNILGLYTVSFKAVDSSLNEVSKTILIDVVDRTAPTASGSLNVSSLISNPTPLGAILNGITVTDNYDNMDNHIKIITLDQYSDNMYVPGTYQVSFDIKDSSNNSTSVTIEITVVDDIAPVISGPTTVTYSYQNVPTMTELKQLLTITDNIDSLDETNLTIISDTFGDRVDDIGNYYITFGVSDSAGNTTEHTITLEGIDDVPPVIYMDSYLVTLDTGTTFNEDDAIRLLLSNNEIPYDDYEITILTNEYLGNETNEGNYKYSIRLQNQQGEMFQKDFTIRVLEDTPYEEDLIVRNVIVYLSVLLIIGYVYYKKH